LEIQYGDTDQRGAGFPRSRDGNGDGNAVCDIGAYEFVAAAPPPPPAGGGSSGCVYNATGKFDPLLPVLILMSILYLLGNSNRKQGSDK